MASMYDDKARPVASDFGADIPRPGSALVAVRFTDDDIPFAIAAGMSHALAACVSGPLYAWGDNGGGQLGNPDAGERSDVPVPVALPLGVTATAFAVGDYHSLAAGSDGRLYAWGDNGGGQLGNPDAGERGDVPVPVALPPGVEATAFAAGGSHSLAAGSDGRLYAWGDNGGGQLGNPDTDDEVNSPVVVGLPDGVRVTAVAAGAFHSFALGSDGRLWTWGLVARALAGTEREPLSAIPPVQVVLPAGVPAIAVAARSSYDLVLGADGQVYSWIAAERSGLHAVSAQDAAIRPAIRLPGDARAVAIAAGPAFGLALSADSRVFEWQEEETPVVPSPSGIGRRLAAQPASSGDWKPYERDEVEELTRKPQPHGHPWQETLCPHCGRVAVRSYYSNSRIDPARGTTWTWCHICHRYTHFSIAKPSIASTIQDPLTQMPDEEFFRLQRNNWYGYLDSLWDQGRLPQGGLRDKDA